jgi:hypothetical protein
VGGMGIHYDGVQYTTTMRAGGSRSVQVASMNILTARTERIRSLRVPLFILRKGRFCNCGCGGFCTLQSLFEMVAWSFRVLKSGVAPASRHDGSPFTEHDKALRLAPGTQISPAGLLQVRGDWEALVQFFKLRSYNADLFCWQCDCTLSPGPCYFGHFEEDAAHRDTRMTHADYITRCAQEGSQPAHLFKCPGFELQHLVVDSMHSADLGCFADALGSILWLEMANHQWTPNQVEGLKSMNKQLDEFYMGKKNLSKITPLVHSQIVGTKPGYPFLKGKAAANRHLAEFALQLAMKHKYGVPARGDVPARAPFRFAASHRLSGRDQEHLDLMLQLFQGMAAYCRSCSAAVFDAVACKSSMLSFLDSLSRLNSLWRSGLPVGSPLAKSAPFHLRQKSHMLQHLVMDHIRTYGSPSQFWCYRDEDFVGRVKSICARTKMPSTLELRVLQKIRVLECLHVRV